MSGAGAENPYQSPGEIPPDAPKEPIHFVGQVEYFKAYRYVFASADWFLNLLFVAICGLIPVVGMIIIVGYQYEVIEALHRRPHQVYPKFDFNFFTHYLTRGVWPFLVMLVVTFLMVPIIIVFAVVVMIVLSLVAGAGGEDAAAASFAIMLPLFFLCYAFFVFLFMLIVKPMEIRAGLAQDFVQAFQWGYIKGFLARVWKEILFTAFFLMITSLPLMMIGYLALIVGAYFAMALMFMAQAHFNYQLYELYLARGGDPIPLKETSPG